MKPMKCQDCDASGKSEDGRWCGWCAGTGHPGFGMWGYCNACHRKGYLADGEQCSVCNGRGKHLVDDWRERMDELYEKEGKEGVGSQILCSCGGTGKQDTLGEDSHTCQICRVYGS